MKFSHLKAVTVVAVVILLAGCASYGTKVTEEQIKQLVPGETTETEVVKILGKPASRTVQPNGKTMFMYISVNVDSKVGNYVDFIIPGQV